MKRHFLFVYYYNPSKDPKITLDINDDQNPINSDHLDDYDHDRLPYQRKLNWIGFFLYMAVILLIVLIGLFLISYYGNGSDEIIIYAEIFGVTSAIAVILQFTPQIYLTYKLKV